MAIKVVTIGAYGFDAQTFFQALEQAGVDWFLDIRRRRGVRGAEYAFANSQRLQARLAQMGIAYHHAIELAPTPAVRRLQEQADKAGKVARRKRAVLDQSFVSAYREEVLSRFRWEELWQEMPADARVVALFCVEREPAACHRSLVAGQIEQMLGVKAEHLLPGHKDTDRAS